jgi:hypothetical protein
MGDIRLLGNRNAFLKYIYRGIFLAVKYAFEKGSHRTHINSP